MAHSAVAVASSWWSSPDTGMHNFARSVLRCAELAGVDAIPLQVPTRRGAALGFVPLSALDRRVSTFLARRAPSGVVHMVDGEYLPGTQVGTVHQFFAFYREHNPVYWQAASVNERLAVRAVVDRSCLVTVSTTGQMEAGRRLFPEQFRKMRLVPLAFDIPDEGERRFPARFDGLWVARWARAKQPGMFLDLARALPGLRFAMVAYGGVPSAQLPQNVVAFPRISDSELDTVYRSSRAIVSTSIGEGWHRAITEAYLRRTPVVVPKIEPYVSIYPERARGVNWYNMGDPDSLRVAFVRAIYMGHPEPEPPVVEMVRPENVGRALRAVYEETVGSEGEDGP